MTQLVILSGKGGTGKTSLSAAVAHLAAADHPQNQHILVDADVDASNLELLLGAKRISSEPFQSGAVAEVEPDLCTTCGRCQEVCRFNAVLPGEDYFQIDPVACEGCAACLYECPEQAISMKPQQAGEWYISETDYGRLFHAHLYPARENSGKLVSHIKRQAQQALEEGQGDWMFVDGPPGIGCPVISAVSGADAVLAVTEPSLAGIHDLKRVLGTSEYFQVPVFVCVNKADLYPEGAEEIKSLCQERDLPFLGEIPYDLAVPQSLAAGIPVTEYQPDGKAARAIREIWVKINQLAAGGNLGAN